jgi:hypothetical protein
MEEIHVKSARHKVNLNYTTYDLNAWFLLIYSISVPFSIFLDFGTMHFSPKYEISNFVYVKLTLVGFVINYLKSIFSFLVFSLNLRPQVLWDLALDVGFWVFSTWKLFRFDFIEVYSIYSLAFIGNA